MRWVNALPELGQDPLPVGRQQRKAFHLLLTRVSGNTCSYQRLLTLFVEVKLQGCGNSWSILPLPRSQPLFQVPGSTLCPSGRFQAGHSMGAHLIHRVLSLGGSLSSAAPIPNHCLALLTQIILRFKHVSCFMSIFILEQQIPSFCVYHILFIQ